jgi:SAM-dependent methyltransferase
MHWIPKIVAFQTLGRIPGGKSIYYGLQHFTGTTRQTEPRLLDKIQQALRYWRWLETNTPHDWLAKASHLELGPGWLPSIPMTFFALGTQRQYLVDINRHMEADDVVNTVNLFRDVASKTGARFVRMPESSKQGLSLEATLKPFGMTYAAPYDDLARQIANSVGFITATHMLLHLDRRTLQRLLRTAHSLLAPGGYFMGLLHLRQLFDSLESKTSPFYSLRYSDSFWESMVNSPMMSYNRLKARDYKSALEETGFEVSLMEIDPGTADDFKKLDQARIHPDMAGYTREELAARHLFLVARKPL